MTFIDWILLLYFLPSIVILFLLYLHDASCTDEACAAQSKGAKRLAITPLVNLAYLIFFIYIMLINLIKGE